MDVNVVERHLLHKVQAHHHHAGNPEENDVKAGDERAGRIEPFQLRRFVGPAQGRERPQRRREPGVEHVFVAPDVFTRETIAPFGIGGNFLSLLGRDLSGFDVMGQRVGDRFVLGLSDKDIAVRPIPSRYLVAPPDLPRDTPRLDVFHPIEEGRFPLRRHKYRLALAHRRHRRLCERFRVDIPLIGEIGLKHRA